jgi:hypothetical protein
MTSTGAWARIGAAAAAVAGGLVVAVIPGAEASDFAVSACTSADLSARQSDTGAGMSQPFSVITVTNISGHACSLTGYPSVTRARTKTGSKSIHTRNARLANGPSADPSHFSLAPGGHAWFTLGTATAYDPPVVTFRRITFTPIAGSAGTITVKVKLPATAPSGQAFPIGVTAFAPGSHP